MNKSLLIAIIAVVLSSCCTKMDCISLEPEFSVDIKAENQEIKVQRFFDNKLTSRKSYSVQKDTILSFSIRKELFASERFEISIGDSLVIIKGFVVEVNSTEEMECNKCFLRKDSQKIETFEVTKFESNGTIYTSNNYSLTF